VVHILGAGGPTDNASIPLATRAKRAIENQRSNESEVAMRQWHRQMSSEHPKFRLRSLRSGYNCVGHVFASRRTWVEPDQLSLIIADDGYREVSMERALPTDVGVCWKGVEAIHVGLVLKVLTLGSLIRLIMLSKLGKFCEYEHEHDDVPRGYEYDRFAVISERIDA
jgi:hypothetical protein